MEILGPPDIHYLSAAVGWVELGNLDEAKAELARVSSEWTSHPNVLNVRWAIHAAEKDWAQALAVGQQLVDSAGEHATGWLHRAYAARRAPGGSLKAARDALLPAVDRFPDEATIPYNLACYACQLGELDEARLWVQRALAVGEKPKLKAMALCDDDLRPLWAEIKNL
jgi:tetratricopeptide (TPR) repeat protein